MKFVVQELEVMFYRHSQLCDALTKFWTDSKWDACVKNFEEKTSAIALWLDEVFCENEVQGSIIGRD